jgi:hypothetical protein
MTRKPKPPDTTPGDDDAPKSAVELAMERLRRKDREAGVEERPLSDVQRRAIAEARSVYEARVAEREILHNAALAGAEGPDAQATLDEEYRRDRDRLASDRDHKIEAIRRGELPK